MVHLASLARVPTILLGSLLLLASLTGSAAGEDPAGQPPASGYAGVEPGVGDRIAAILVPRRQAVLSAEVPGRVVTINKELGQWFDAGEALVQLDDSTYRANKRIGEARLESARSDLARVQKLTDKKTRQRHAEAVLAAAEANLAATRRLYNDNHASHIDLENAKRDLTVAQTNRELVDSTSAKEVANARRELAVATGKLEITAEQLKACTLVGPWAGRVARVLVNEHELVERGTPVIEVIDDRILLVKFLLPSSVFRAVGVGQELNLAVAETSDTVVIKVSHIAAALDPASVTFEVHAEVDNADGNLRAGMNGWLSLTEIKGR
ncbi:MAG: HlyD family efflux transporter periplasmic adaptor subunit [Phycisphaerae bacterium]